MWHQDVWHMPVYIKGMPHRTGLYLVDIYTHTYITFGFDKNNYRSFLMSKTTVSILETNEKITKI